MLMDTLSSFGFILYFFLIGVQMDPCLFKNVGRKAIAIGLFTVAVPMVMSTASSFFIMSHVSIDQNIAGSLPMIAQAESVLAFPIVAQFLAELNIINSEFGRVALSSSFVAGLCSFSVITTTVLMQQSSGDNYAALQTLTNAVFLLVVIVFVMRPIIMWMIKHNPEGKPLKESYVIWLLLAVFVTGFLSQALGLHLYFGPLAFGITIPAGPPIGSALVEKLDLLTTVSSCSSIPLRDAASLGLVMNAQGVLELGMFKMMKKNKAIDNEAFVIMAVSMMLVTGAISPIIKHLYDPSRRYAVYRRRTVMNLKPNFELGVLVYKRTSLIIVPFHKRFQVSDAANSHKRAIKITNENVIDKAPCSTAILVDRGPQNVQRTSLNVQSSYRVAVLFLGGPDDREALAIGARMTGHHSINLTMVRLLENGSAGDNATERRLDNEVVSEFRMATAGNYRVIYIEEMVMDGTGTTSVIRSMENCYELVIVGRHHDSRSPLLSGLADWNDHKELGTVGDLLASSPFMDKTTILVVQQHNNATNEDC
ncbi:hypothetical protein GH714_029896 [Hevea brasiliensis]|uniref:Uncharacterized protein n=1 Tax=Hevea brasiliensis TaxID=3981 RepID=A0A6A6LN31_HEVBR|nr:hypothetical protein GH714_029896 [Hevea brasiliensis]